MTGAITFNGTSLQTFSAATNTGIITDTIDHADIPEKDVALLQLANTNMSIIPYVGFPSKKIMISGTIIGSSQIDVDSRVDAFKSLFSGKNRNLDITYNGVARRYIVTTNTVAVKIQQKATYATFNIECICASPFAQDTTPTTALNQTGRTSNAYTDPHTFLGNAPYMLPLITITYSVVTGGSSYVSFGNNGNGQGIMIPDQTWAAGDILEIDVANRTVKKNGVEVDFLGAFPEFAPGAQNFSYSDGFTTRTFAITVTYYPLYL